MKKILFSLTALALCAMMFTSCKKDKDDDKEESKVSELSATVKDGVFKTSAAAFLSSSSADNTGTSKLSQIFSSTDGSTTIAGTEKGKQLAITIKGTTSGTYNLSVGANTSVNKALIELLSGGTIQDVIKDAVNVETNAMIIYRTVGQTEGSNDYWFSTKASVTFDNSLVLYATGTFTADMRNKAGDSFAITDGKFKVFGK
ncbi:MAG: hypothetical protein IIU03_01580 [Bacteroidales bacterium]|nr:hypothetical protein [Bacteroidales bacterium]MBQ5538910.1 hypothetical protein [Bacteroidales bacterium]MEE3448418.1 hypothetical protein [Bacteroidales bacterium]